MSILSYYVRRSVLIAWGVQPLNVRLLAEKVLRPLHPRRAHRQGLPAEGLQRQRLRVRRAPAFIA